MSSAPGDDESLFGGVAGLPPKLGRGFNRMGPFADRWHRDGVAHSTVREASLPLPASDTALEVVIDLTGPPAAIATASQATAGETTARDVGAPGQAVAATDVSVARAERSVVIPFRASRRSSALAVGAEVSELDEVDDRPFALQTMGSSGVFVARAAATERLGLPAAQPKVLNFQPDAQPVVPPPSMPPVSLELPPSPTSPTLPMSLRSGPSEQSFRDIRKEASNPISIEGQQSGSGSRRREIPQRWRLLLGLTLANIVLATVVYFGFVSIDRLVAEPLVIDGERLTSVVVERGSTVRTIVALRNTTSTPLNIVGIRSDGTISLASRGPLVVSAEATVAVPLDVTVPFTSPPTQNPELRLPFALATAVVGSDDIRYTELSLSTIERSASGPAMAIRRQAIGGLPVKAALFNGQLIVANSDGRLIVMSLASSPSTKAPASRRSASVVATSDVLAKQGRRVTGLATDGTKLYVAFSDWALRSTDQPPARGSLAEVSIVGGAATLNTDDTTTFSADIILHGLPTGPDLSGLGEIGIRNGQLFIAIGPVAGDRSGLAGSIARLDLRKSSFRTELARQRELGVPSTGRGIVASTKSLTFFSTGLASAQGMWVGREQVVVTDVSGDVQVIRDVTQDSYLGLPHPSRGETNRVDNGLSSIMGSTYKAPPQNYLPPRVWLGKRNDVQQVAVEASGPLKGHTVISGLRGLRSVSADGSEVTVISNDAAFATVSSLLIGPQGEVIAIDPSTGQLIVGELSSTAKS